MVGCAVALGSGNGWIRACKVVASPPVHDLEIE
jgi:hypothetical protein